MDLSLAPIIDKLRAAGLDPVEGLLELKAMTAPPARLPAYFVVPTDETAQPNNVAGARDQRVTVAFSVVITLRGARHGDTVNDELKQTTRRVKDALTGWTHPDASSPCDYVGGRLLSGSGSTIEWRVRFSTRYHLRRPS